MKEFEVIADKYVESFGEILPGLKYGHRYSQSFHQSHYFDFTFLTLEGRIPEREITMGGACGFTISKDSHKIECLSFAALSELQAREKELNEIFERLLLFKQGAGSLTWLKSKYQFNSTELLQLKQLLDRTELERDEILYLLDEMIHKVK